MKIILKMSEMGKIFSELMEEIKEKSVEIRKEIEDSGYKIEGMKGQRGKKILTIMNGIKIDFDFNVVFNNGFHITNIDQDLLIGLYLKSDEIVLNFEEKEGFALEQVLLERGVKGFHFFDLQNDVTPGMIDWEELTKSAEDNWNSSLFFLNQMNNNDFLNENKKMIFEKIKESPELLKEAIIKNRNMIFLDYCMERLTPVTILEYVKESQSHLGYFWNKKIKLMIEGADVKKVIEKERGKIEDEINEFERLVYYKYDYSEDCMDLIDNTKKRLYKGFEKRKKEIIETAKEMYKELEDLKMILDEDTVKVMLLKEILNTLDRGDFELFEDDILRFPEIKKMVIENGIMKNNCITKNFMNSLSKEEFKEFLVNSEKEMDSLFFFEAKNFFAQIVPKDLLLEVLRENVVGNLKILDEVRSKDKELNHLLFMVNPIGRFDSLNKKEITDEEIMWYLKNGGYLNKVKEKVNIYQIDDVEIIKEIVKQDFGYLKNRKTNGKWKEDPEIIREVLKSNNTLEYSELNKENVESLAQNMEDCMFFTKEDSSYIFYSLLPENLKRDKGVARSLMSGAKERNDITRAFKLLSQVVLLDKRFTVNLVKDNPEIAGLIKQELWNDKEFILTLLKEVKENNKENELKKNLPKNIKLFLETFNIHDNLYVFFNNYFLQKKIEEDLKDKSFKNKKRFKL